MCRLYELNHSIIYIDNTDYIEEDFPHDKTANPKLGPKGCLAPSGGLCVRRITSRTKSIKPLLISHIVPSSPFPTRRCIQTVRISSLRFAEKTMMAGGVLTSAHSTVSLYASFERLSTLRGIEI